MWRSPAGRGLIMLSVMSAALGFAMNAHNNLLTNYFNDILHLSAPQFGYITAIREIGGFFIMFLTAFFYRISLQKLAAGAIVILAAGYALFSLASGFWSVVPWVLVTSFGAHAVLQVQPALGLSLTTPARSGAILGRMGAMAQGGTFAALIMIFLIFKFGWLSYRPTFIILGGVAFISALAIVRFPHLHEGRLRRMAPKREPLVWSRFYRRYYLICVLDGARQQVFFSFGLWVLVNRFGLGVAEISLVLLAVTFASIITTPRFGRALDRWGERRVLTVVNVAFIVALAGYALANGVVLACAFYCVYALIAPVAYMGGSTYLRRICAPQDLAASLAMGLTISHATAIVVPVLSGFILNYVGYQVPFYAACGIAVAAFFVCLRLDPTTQKCPGRIAADEEAVREASIEPPDPRSQRLEAPSAS
jgi:predicted MFS family arabinose efflux permease